MNLSEQSESIISYILDLSGWLLIQSFIQYSHTQVIEVGAYLENIFKEHETTFHL